MAIFDIFKRKNTKESNTLFGQTQLGNQIVRQTPMTQQCSNFQFLYVTT